MNIFWNVIFDGNFKIKEFIYKKRKKYEKKNEIKSKKFQQRNEFKKDLRK